MRLETVRIGSRTYDAEVLRDNGKVHVCVPEFGSLVELTALFGGVGSVEVGGEQMDGYEVESVLLMRSTQSDLWDGRRVTVVLAEQAPGRR